jgi:TonB family protein
MKEPSLQKTTALSLILHLTALLIALILVRQTNHFIAPSPYTVSLVGPEMLSSNETGERINISKTMKGTTVMEAVPERDIKKKDKKTEKNIEDTIAALSAKKRVERIVRLRSIISLKAGSSEKGDTSGTTSGYQKKGNAFDDYYTRIRREIWNQWVFPDTGRKDLETIISIRIMKDGTIITQKIEKSSGNSLFDRSAIKALTKASPLSPPPHEMEIGVRFSL